MIIVLISMLIYGLFHTLLAGQFKNWFQQHFSDRVFYGLYRLIFNIIAIITLIPTYLLMSMQSHSNVWEIPTNLQPILLIIQAISGIGLIVSLLQIDLLRFLGLRQFIAYLNDAPLPLPNEPLQIRGLYKVVRHPLYLFSIILMWSVSTMSDVYLGFCVGATLYFVIGSLYEERRLAKIFGEAYIEYQQQVPWLIPFVRLPF